MMQGVIQKMVSVTVVTVPPIVTSLCITPTAAFNDRSSDDGVSWNEEDYTYGSDSPHGEEDDWDAEDDQMDLPDEIAYLMKTASRAHSQPRPHQ